MPPIDVEYYRERAATERDRAKSAAQPKIAAIHLELASLYERLIELKVQEAPPLRAVGSVEG